MISSGEARSRLNRVLNESVASMRALHAALGEERRALESRDSEALERALAEKRQHISVLTRLEKSRKDICVGAGFTTDDRGMRDITAWCDEQDALAATWQAYREAAGDCDRLNLANGAAIRLRREQVAQNLMLLRGGQREQDTYTPNGDAPPAAGRTLIEA